MQIGLVAPVLLTCLRLFQGLAGKAFGFAIALIHMAMTNRTPVSIMNAYGNRVAAVGGQLVGTMVFINHHAPYHQKGFYGGLALAGASLGTLVGSLIGSLVYVTLTPEQLQSYGFRIPFLCGWLVALAGFMLHKKVSCRDAIVVLVLYWKC